MWCWQLWHSLVTSWTATFIIAYTGWLCPVPASALVWSAFNLFVLFPSSLQYFWQKFPAWVALLVVICFIGSNLFWCIFCVFRLWLLVLSVLSVIVSDSIYWICIFLHFAFSAYNKKTFLALVSRSLWLSQIITGHWTMVFVLDISILTILWTKWLKLQKLSYF